MKKGCNAFQTGQVIRSLSNGASWPFTLGQMGCIIACRPWGHIRNQLRTHAWGMGGDRGAGIFTHQFPIS